jgi:hypothetical protein
VPERRCSSQWPHRKSPATNRLWRDRTARVDAGHRDEIRSLARQVDRRAVLNHPHIVAIYGLEESDGVTTLVMERVEGEDRRSASLAA